MQPRSLLHSRPRRGSILIVAMILSAIIGVSIASYIRLGTTAHNLSNRAFYNNAAMNLAEAGLEQAMWSINTMATNNGALSPAWDQTGYGWYSYVSFPPNYLKDFTAVSGGGPHNWAYRWFNFFQFDQNTTGGVIVMVRDFDGIRAAPSMTAYAWITPTGALGGLSSGTWWPNWGWGTNQLAKWVRVSLYKRSKFSNGLVAKDTINFSGTNARVDSWNSDPDNSTATPAIPYSAGVAHDLGSVGSIAVTAAVSVQNADIWGYVATGGTVPSVGANGLVGPYGTTSGTMDMTHVSTDFTASFDAVTVPTTAATNLGNITSGLTLPRGGDTAAADGKYYYTAGQINFNNDTLLISGKVVLILTNTSTSIDIGGGSGVLSITAAGSLECYAPGDVKIAGKGISNGVDADADGVISASESGQPIQCQIYGTGTSVTKQDYQIAGNGALSAVVYAPNGSLKINGNGDVGGSFVANDITVVGNASFHYDESLANLVTGNPYGIVKWDELTAASTRQIWW